MRLLLAVKVLLFTLLVPGSVVVYFPYSFVTKAGAQLQTANPLLFSFAIVCLVLGTMTYIRCAWEFAIRGLGTPAPIDPPKKLVVTGFYRYSRNPMYQGVMLLLIAEWLLFPNAGLSFYVLSIATVFHLFVIWHEEPALERRFGPSYQDYCRKVPRWGFALRPFQTR
ncbi:methyltransferase family protein [Methylomonas sp. MgM2]